MGAVNGGSRWGQSMGAVDGGSSCRLPPPRLLLSVLLAW